MTEYLKYEYVDSCMCQGTLVKEQSMYSYLCTLYARYWIISELSLKDHGMYNYLCIVYFRYWHGLSMKDQSMNKTISIFVISDPG